MEVIELFVCTVSPDTLGKIKGNHKETTRTLVAAVIQNMIHPTNQAQQYLKVIKRKGPFFLIRIRSSECDSHAFICIQFDWTNERIKRIYQSVGEHFLFYLIGCPLGKATKPTKKKIDCCHCSFTTDLAVCLQSLCSVFVLEHLQIVCECVSFRYV